jgi:GNAT superfamily N-acetyltransferase
MDLHTRPGGDHDEVQLLAVHPAHQNQGIGAGLSLSARGQTKKRGMTMAKVETGGDPSRAPARRSFEKAGYTALPPWPGAYRFYRMQP